MAARASGTRAFCCDKEGREREESQRVTEENLKERARRKGRREREVREREKEKERQMEKERQKGRGEEKGGGEKGERKE